MKSSREILHLIEEQKRLDEERRAAFATGFERHPSISKLVGTEEESHWRALLWWAFNTGCNHGSIESQSMNTREVVWIVRMSPMRLTWLKHLAEHGTTGWERMPKNARGYSAGNSVWLPMRAEGWITGECHAPRNGQDPFDWYFTITDAGRAAIEKATQ